GDLLEVRAEYPPDSSQPPAHYHPNQEERFEVLRGRFEAVIDGEEAVYEAGDSF
ncbi:MAG: cupin domain-containing protein, partial [Actinobacteria bacterium]|nr:cupin domain-containing protein [Actinomycetota bacterium]NIW27829.1 cupin domain-containing protein [Actinomycetota bacterium]NIX22774.1 cupin domain-containing protein [Actinomycetota bacterium]